jgi:hypothetical protein
MDTPFQVLHFRLSPGNMTLEPRTSSLNCPLIMLRTELQMMLRESPQADNCAANLLHAIGIQLHAMKEFHDATEVWLGRFDELHVRP